MITMIIEQWAQWSQWSISEYNMGWDQPVSLNTWFEHPFGTQIQKFYLRTDMDVSSILILISTVLPSAICGAFNKEKFRCWSWVPINPTPLLWRHNVSILLMYFVLQFRSTERIEVRVEYEGGGDMGLLTILMGGDPKFINEYGVINELIINLYI